MKRLLLLVGITAACQAVWSPQAQAHWRFGCRSYYGGSYYSPQWYYPSYSTCWPCYGGNGSSYGSYYGNAYPPYSAYGFSPQYSYLGPGYSGNLPGGSLLGSLGAYRLFGANLTGSLVQPSYLSMPVGVGYGQLGYLQIPVGNPAGRASYLQIPVSSGFGPPSYLQIDLGRNPGSTGSDAPAAVPTPKPLAAVPGDGFPTTRMSTYGIHQTSADDDLPPVVPATGDLGYNIAADDVEASSADSLAAAESRAAGNVTTSGVRFQLISWPKSRVVSQSSHRASATLLRNNTSFSLIDDDVKGPAVSQTELIVTGEAANLPDRELTPWIAN